MKATSKGRDYSQFLVIQNIVRTLIVRTMLFLKGGWGVGGIVFAFLFFITNKRLLEKETYCDNNKTVIVQSIIYHECLF